MNDISLTIKNLRKKANLTQSEFANAVGKGLLGRRKRRGILG